MANFSKNKIKKHYSKLKKSELFYDATPQKAVEYLWAANDAFKRVANRPRYIGFFRSSDTEDCITFSVVNTELEEINHCSYKIMEDGKIVNLQNLRHEREEAMQYEDLEDMANSLQKNMNFLKRDEIVRISKRNYKS